MHLLSGESILVVNSWSESVLAGHKVVKVNSHYKQQTKKEKKQETP